MSDEPRDGAFDEWLDALEDDEPYYLECPEGHGSLPPRRVCPDCGATDLEQRPLPAGGEIETFTITHVPTPAFEEDAPYATAVADFGPVRVTGQVAGVDLEEIENGLTVEPAVGVSETTDERVLTLRPR
ncbi:Zn-ribbon domain-containing OB-fold protein [Natrialbaceae archaeon AArc-T1-2]|uniref:Zn-ribbon domain-containing OB-fold protein n=1 Tax=Natrialbaceae archaeon AArc-T1-2 TaxID=3053904 RepID=UPI00255AF314|nr:OB-fold domain-containing protein [Natrialbaceae archaeon AArc-T1-2]WIV68729.1 OB-fold domain-containing protein [Natrialbaceae archaeon AArc-T1-2]